MTTKDTSKQFGLPWLIALWVLVTLFAVDGALNMLGIHIVFLTTQAADLSGPAILYIITRRSWRLGNKRLLTRIIGRSPELTAGILFGACAVTEISQYFWPNGIFRGRFDPLDLGAFAVSVLACYAFEKAGMGMIFPIKQSADDPV